MKKSYQEHMMEDRRLALLRLLVEADGHANESVLMYGIRALGHIKTTPEQLRADLEFLRETGLVTHEWFKDSVLVAKLTQRGVNVAEGSETVAGVKKPSIV